MRREQLVIDDTGSVEGIYAFIYCTKWISGRVSRMPDRQTTLKDRATQLLIKYKSGALVTQQCKLCRKIFFVLQKILLKLCSSGLKARCLTYSILYWRYLAAIIFISTSFSWAEMGNISWIVSCKCLLLSPCFQDTLAISS